jgi:hypothetical protein
LDAALAATKAHFPQQARGVEQYFERTGGQISSGTSNFHRQLLRAGVHAELVVFDHRRKSLNVGVGRR